MTELTCCDFALGTHPMHTALSPWSVPVSSEHSPLHFTSSILQPSQTESLPLSLVFHKASDFLSQYYKNAVYFGNSTQYTWLEGEGWKLRSFQWTELSLCPSPTTPFWLAQVILVGPMKWSICLLNEWPPQTKQAYLSIWRPILL